MSICTAIMWRFKQANFSFHLAHFIFRLTHGGSGSQNAELCWYGWNGTYCENINFTWDDFQKLECVQDPLRIYIGIQMLASSDAVNEFDRSSHSCFNLLSLVVHVLLMHLGKPSGFSGSLNNDWRWPLHPLNRTAALWRYEMYPLDGSRNDCKHITALQSQLPSSGGGVAEYWRE